MHVRLVQHGELDAWVTLRHALWPTSKIDDLFIEAQDILTSAEEVCIVAIDDQCACIVGFLEGAIHHTPHDAPYAHVEGWYVTPEYRQQGFGKELMREFEQWCLHRAICLLTSDTTAEYPTSSAAHAGCGYQEICEFKIFLKKL